MMAGADTTAPRPWSAQVMDGAFAELEHPADLWLELYGPDLPTLFSHGLYALYSHLVDLGDVLPLRHWRLTAWGTDAADALRALLAEALYRFDTEALVGACAQVEITARTGAGLEVTATVWGESFDRTRQEVLTEIKAVTYHELRVEQDVKHGWRASVLFDV